MLSAAEPGAAGGVGNVSKRVIEAKTVHVSLKRRLKFTHDEKMIIAGRVHYTERDGLNSQRYAGYGTDHHMPIYREVPAAEHDTEEGRLVATGVYRAGQEGRGGGRRDQADRPATMCSLCNSLLCCSCCVSEWEDANLKTIFMAGKPIWYFRYVPFFGSAADLSDYVSRRFPESCLICQPPSHPGSGTNCL